MRILAPKAPSQRALAREARLRGMYAEQMLQLSVHALEPLRPRFQRGHLPFQRRLKGVQFSKQPPPERGDAERSEAEGFRIIRVLSCNEQTL